MSRGIQRSHPSSSLKQRSLMRPTSEPGLAQSTGPGHISSSGLSQLWCAPCGLTLSAVRLHGSIAQASTVASTRSTAHSRPAAAAATCASWQRRVRQALPRAPCPSKAGPQRQAHAPLRGRPSPAPHCRPRPRRPRRAWRSRRPGRSAGPTRCRQSRSRGRGPVSQMPEPCHQKQSTSLSIAGSQARFFQ